MRKAVATREEEASAIETVAPFQRRRNLAPYDVTLEAERVTISRRWWPITPFGRVPLIEDRHLAHVLGGLAFGAVALALSAIVGARAELLRKDVLPGLFAIAFLGYSVWHRSRLPKEIVFDRAAHLLRVDSLVVPINKLNDALPRVVSATVGSAGPFDVRLTLPTQQQLLLGQFRDRSDAESLANTVAALLVNR